MAPLRCAAKFDPFLSLDCTTRPPPWNNPRKGRDQILLSGNTEPWCCAYNVNNVCVILRLSAHNLRPLMTDDDFDHWKKIDVQQQQKVDEGRLSSEI